VASNIRKRDQIYQSGGGSLRTTQRRISDGFLISDTKQSSVGNKVTGSQLTVSEGHPWHNRRFRRGFHGDIGGDFYTQRTYVEGLQTRKQFAVVEKFGNTEITYQYNGQAPPVNISNNLFPPFLVTTDSVLNALGAQAIAKCKPTNSPADAATALAELLKEGLPNLVGSQFWQDRSRPARSAGSEYLNVEFGWKPLVNDITKFLSAVDRASTLMKQYERDAGRVVRRNFRFPIQRTRTETVGALSSLFLEPDASALYDSSNRGNLITIKETMVDRWFSGAFTYYLPSGYDSRNGMDRAALLAQEILGLDLTPEVLWNVAPWSWAVDWFTNTGDVVSNISDFGTDGLVLRYGYLMEHTINKWTYTNAKTGLKNPAIRTSPISFIAETKSRRRANPFGFGLTDDDLSDRQKSIIVALGLSRGQR
jgi:hypothetical protein